MGEFSINSNYLENIRSTVNEFPEYKDRICTIIINETFKIELPLIVASSFSSSITKIIKNDPTTKEFHFSLQTNSLESLNKIKSVLCEHSKVTLNEENDEDIYSFAEFGVSIGNDDFINPLKVRLSKRVSEMNDNNVVDILRSKKTFHINDMNEEIIFISSHFEKMSVREDFINFSKETPNAGIVESIISSDKLSMNSEDTLLTFLMAINKSKTRENISAELFNHVFIEYCSANKCEEFISFICNIIQEQNTKALISCLGRRCVQPKIPMNPKYIKGRHEKVGTLIDNKDPLNGILRRENQKGNVLINASSTYCGDVNNLVKAGDNLEFYTNNVENSFVEASLKDRKTFIIKSYMIRGNCGSSYQIKNWKIEGQKEDGQWILLDSRNGESTSTLQVKTFNISCEEELKSVRLTQIGKSADGYYYFRINAFDIFGVLIE